VEIEGGDWTEEIDIEKSQKKKELQSPTVVHTM
jgi:hypothetical protein